MEMLDGLGQGGVTVPFYSTYLSIYLFQYLTREINFSRLNMICWFLFVEGLMPGHMHGRGIRCLIA